MFNIQTIFIAMPRIRGSMKNKWVGIQYWDNETKIYFQIPWQKDEGFVKFYSSYRQTTQLIIWDVSDVAEGETLSSCLEQANLLCSTIEQIDAYLGDYRKPETHKLLGQFVKVKGKWRSLT